MMDGFDTTQILVIFGYWLLVIIWEMHCVIQLNLCINRGIRYSSKSVQGEGYVAAAKHKLVIGDWAVDHL